VTIMVEKPTVTLFTRKGCHLCEKAKEVIHDLGTKINFHYEEYDIEAKEEWTENYGLMIPVVLINGKEIQYGRIDGTTLSKVFEKIL
jgi:glutaredoxin